MPAIQRSFFIFIFFHSLALIRFLILFFFPFFQVASKNPHAWFQGVKHSAETISTPTPNNRYITYPYTKLMNAFPMVNQSASVVLTTVHQARFAGIPEEQWVFPLGGAHFFDVHDFS